MQNFRALGAPPPDPRASGGCGLRPQTPQTASPLRISGYAPGQDTCEILISAAELMFLCMYALGVHSSFFCWLILYCSFIF